jgi:hypothetical protein
MSKKTGSGTRPPGVTASQHEHKRCVYRPTEHISDCLLGCFLCILCRDVADSVKLEFWLQPGDLQVVHNQTQVHNRSAYEDHDVSDWDAGAQHCAHSAC